jgi:hypothetical protein
MTIKYDYLKIKNVKISCPCTIQKIHKLIVKFFFGKNVHFHVHGACLYNLYNREKINFVRRQSIPIIPTLQYKVRRTVYS